MSNYLKSKGPIAPVPPFCLRGEPSSLSDMDSMHAHAPGLRVLLVLAGLGLACGSPPPAPPVEAPKAVESPVATGESTQASSSPTPTSGVPVITSFGVAECDNYVKKYMECVDGKVSGEARDKLLETFTANQTKWRAMSTMREAGIALGIACKASLIKAKEELSVEYGCEF